MSDAAAYTAGKRADFKLPTSSICQSSEQHHVSSPDICTQTDGIRCALAGLCTLQTAWIHADKHMRSNFSSPEFPGNFFKPASDLDPRARNKPEREQRHGPTLKMESGYFCCVTQHYAEESCQRYSVSSTRCKTTSFNRSPGCKVYISIPKLHVQVLHVSASFPLAIAATTIHSASANVTSNFNLSA